jgi:predicted RNase H-like nuclease
VTSWSVLGIDPAPSKDTVAFDGERFHRIRPQDIRDWLIERLTGEVLVSWDAPLAFDPAQSFYTRPVDKTLAAFCRDEPAVNVAPFGNLSHWSITCHALGYPFGQPPENLVLVAEPAELPRDRPAVIEVHPALAMLLWWRQRRSEPFPQYKRGPSASRLAALQEILDTLSSCLPMAEAVLAAAQADPPRADDYLDAAVAYELGVRFAAGTTHTVGDRVSGFIVLPDAP